MADQNSVDLRDEVQFLRELVERLLFELEGVRDRALKVHIVPQPPIIIELPAPVRPWLQDRWYWNTIGNDPFGTTCTTVGTTGDIIQWNNVTDQDPPEDVGMPART